MRKHLLKLTSLLSVVLAVALFAPQRAAADDDDDPPSRVARLSYTHGNVSFNPAGTDDWVTAVVNRPVTTGDKLWADNGARAELNIGSAAIRLSGNTGFSFLNLDDRTTQIRITEGTLNVRVRRLENDETFEIDTPNLAFQSFAPATTKSTSMKPATPPLLLFATVKAKSPVAAPLTRFILGKPAHSPVSTSSTLTFRVSAITTTTSTGGAVNATIAKITRNPPATSLRM